MTALSAAAVLFLLKAGAAPAPATTIDFLYSVSPYPAPEAKYVACDTPEAQAADHCVVGGTWVGLCSKSATPDDFSRMEGPLVFTDGIPRIQGCDNSRWMWKPPSAATAAYVAPKAGSLKMANKTQSVTLTQGGRTFAVTLTKKTFQLQVKEGAETRVLDVRPALGEAVKLADFPRLDYVGDLNGDGAPEAVVSIDTQGFTRAYEPKWGVTTAVVVTLADPLRVIGFTSSSPTRLYGAKNCAELGCDIIRFLEKQESCNHLAGEEGYDEARQKELAKAMKGCEALDARRQSLLKKHGANEAVKKALLAEQELGD
ncbi:hypothetical protein A176_007552 [Myxococcus hansupus]|uniref:Lipoprotein n=1 Tax=Pseudomyxococcus hansupus TaxID=1297742 RepID=A0A0H4XAF5_9BACT|nr:hypothetical protein [Myxococcus hansupus]AKQ70640.1 hypothetical protein A176_007552 [Myxococcus hansupus]